jgi:hypothetical protein
MFLVDEVMRDTSKQQRPQKVDNFGTEAGSIVFGA